MKRQITALRYFAGIMAIQMALTLVSFAQATQPEPGRRMRPAAEPTTIEHLITEWTRAKAFTREYLDTMPADGITFKPTPDIRSFGQQMLHLTAANFSFAIQATGAKPPAYDLQKLEANKAFEDKAALTQIVMESYDFAMAALKSLDPAKYNEKVKLFDSVETTRFIAFEKAFEHQTHHRGQTTIYLRMKGVKPPNEKLF